MSYLTQMLALAVQNFVCAASGMAVMVALVRGISRKTTSTLGNFWVDLTRSTLYILLPLSVVLALVFVSQGVVQTFGAYHVGGAAPGDQGRRRQRRDRPGPRRSGPAASQIAIKKLGTNGGGFFNVNSAHPFENPTPLRQLPQHLRAAPHPGGAHLHVRQDGQGHPPGLGHPGGDVRRVPAAARPLRGAGAGGQPRARVVARRPGGERAAGRRQHGGQGGALRHLGDRPLRDSDDRRVVRRRQRDARLVHAARRARAALAHPARRDHLRRRRRRDVRHAHVRRRRRLRRRPDGRAHARVPRQEDRGQGDEDGVARHPRPRRDNPRLHGDRRRHRVGQEGRLQPRAARLQRDPLRVLVGHGQQRQRLRRPRREHALLQHAPRPRDVPRSLLHQGAGARARGRARREEDRARPARGRCPRTRRSSSRCSSASSSSSAR